MMKKTSPQGGNGSYRFLVALKTWTGESGMADGTGTLIYLWLYVYFKIKYTGWVMETARDGNWEMAKLL